jgi:hypothetical protein
VLAELSASSTPPPNGDFVTIAVIAGFLVLAPNLGGHTL